MSAAMAAPPNVDDFDYTTLRAPSTELCRVVAQEMNLRMFERADCRIHFKFENLVYVLNALSKKKHAPNPTKLPWGDALAAAVSMQSSMKKIGVRGTDEQHNTKRAALAMLTATDPATGKVLNRPLLNAVAPHKDRWERAKYVNKSVARRAEFEATGDANKFCHDIPQHSADSLV